MRAVTSHRTEYQLMVAAGDYPKDGEAFGLPDFDPTINNKE